MELGLLLDLQKTNSIGVSDMNLFDQEIFINSSLHKDSLPAFIMLLAFVITFICARGYTRIARKTGWGSASFGGVHAHHLVFGMVIAFIAGAATFGLTPSSYSPFFLLLAAAFGCGVALVLDEFALLFHLKDVYWSNEGRSSIDAVVIALVLGVLMIIGVAPFGSNGDFTHTYLLMTIAINLPILLIAGLKGKIKMALFGVFIPLLGLVGAIRLAKPNSPWAKFMYKNHPKKVNRTTKRHKRYDKTWLHYKDRLWDLIGGKPQMN